MSPISNVFKLPVEQLPIKRFCLGHVCRHQLDVYKWIPHDPTSYWWSNFSSARGYLKVPGSFVVTGDTESLAPRKKRRGVWWQTRAPLACHEAGGRLILLGGSKSQQRP